MAAEAAIVWLKVFNESRAQAYGNATPVDQLESHFPLSRVLNPGAYLQGGDKTHSVHIHLQW